MKAFGCKTFGDYVCLYCAFDVELLSIILEKFIRMSMQDFALDPSKSYMSAGFFWEVMLKMTGVQLEMLTNPKKYAFFETCIRGGVSVISNRLADANNAYLQDYDPKKKSSYIMGWDTNSLYASVMVQELPVGKFRWIRSERLRNLGDMAKRGEKLPEGMGASLCVDLQYPHNLHSDYPVINLCFGH